MPRYSVVNDVISRLSAASPTFQTFDAYRTAYSPNPPLPVSGTCQPIFPGLQSSSMSVRIQLDPPQDRLFHTNLDRVTGLVILSLATDTTISAVNVKLEGESRSRLYGPKFQNDPRNRQKINLEVHKLLYKVQTVFPDPKIVENAANLQIALAAGQYTYPFSFKIPFNNDCASNSTLFSDLNLGSFLGPDPVPARHTKQTLPPTLSGFPGMVEIKYYIKATVVRPKFYQENVRSLIDMKFSPVEPPRPEPRNEETYARRQHQFQSATPKIGKDVFLRKIMTPNVEEKPLGIKVEARLPSPPIITCNHPLPLRVLVEKTTDSPASIYLSLLHIELIVTTHIRAHDLNRTETSVAVLMSQANMKLLLDNPSDRSGRSIPIPKRYWDHLPVPANILPSFNTCNVSRSYELEVRVGLNHGMADGIRPELAVLPLRLAVEVFSGIPPPARILNRLTAQNAVAAGLAPSSSSQPQPHRPSVASTQSHESAQPDTYMSPPLEDPNDLPPSYEDAMAEDITPADGPRHEPGTPSRQQTFAPDVKSSSGLQRHPSERLFSQNGPSAPTSRTWPKTAAQTTATTTTSQSRGSAPDDMTDLFADLRMDEDSNGPAAPPLPVRKGTGDNGVER